MMNHLKQLIPLARKYRGWSQGQMAKALKLSYSAYGKLERHETDISVERLKQIFAILNVTYEDILEYEATGLFRQHGIQKPIPLTDAVAKRLYVSKLNTLLLRLKEKREREIHLLKQAYEFSEEQATSGK